MQNVLTWVERLRRRCPIQALSLELVRFDTQRLQQPEMAGTEHQQGELAGYEFRQYLLEKWGRKCAYCVTPVKGHHSSGEQSPASSGKGGMLSVLPVTERRAGTIV